MLAQVGTFESAYINKLTRYFFRLKFICRFLAKVSHLEGKMIVKSDGATCNPDGADLQLDGADLQSVPRIHSYKTTK